MRRISNTFSLMKSAFDVLRADPALLLFPVFSGLFTLLVIASFVLPFLATGSAGMPLTANLNSPVGYVYLFLFYYISYFVVLFFNAASVTYSIDFMRGGRPTIQTAMRAVMNRLTHLLGWTFIASSVGLILNSLENQSDAIGKIVIGFLGLSWTVISFLVLPILIIEGKGPVESLKISAKMLKNSWGEQLIGHFSFGLIFTLLMIPIVLTVILLMQLGGPFIIIGIVAGVIAGIGFGIVQWSLQSIFMGTVYLYVREEKVPAGFSLSQISNALH